MPATLPISYDRQAPGTRSITFSVGGTPLNMTGYTGRMQVWRSGQSTTSSALFTLTETTGLTLGTAGALTIDMVAFEAAVVTNAPTEAMFHYALDVRSGTNARVNISSGPIARAMP